MKPVASLILFTTLCACARQEPATVDAARTATDTPGAAMSTDRPKPDTTTPPGAPGAVAATRDATTTTPAPSTAPPPGARGIAVGEPHPSGAVAIDPGPARYDGYGALRFGMSAGEARAAWSGALKGDDVAAGQCGYLSPAGTAAGPYLMFEGGQFVRYDVRGANTTAPGGGRVGMSADDIRRLYAGRVDDAPHHYVEGGHNLRILDPASKSRALLFEVDAHGRVTTWRVGRTPQVDYVEGCS